MVIGAGVHLPRNGLVLFEAPVNAVHRMAPQAAIAFNMRLKIAVRQRRMGPDLRLCWFSVNWSAAALR